MLFKNRCYWNDSILKAETGALTYFLMQLLMHGLDSYNYAVSEPATGAVAYGAQGSYYPSSLVPHPCAPVPVASYSKQSTLPTYTQSRNKGWKHSSRRRQNGGFLERLCVTGSSVCLFYWTANCVSPGKVYITGRHKSTWDQFNLRN